MRTEIAGIICKKEIIVKLKLILQKDMELKLVEKRKKNIVILVTKEQHCLGDLLIRYAFNELKADIKCVIGNHRVIENFTSKFNVPFHFISHEGINRSEDEEELLNVLQNYNPGYIILAKFMRILSGSFVDAFPNRIINIHHSFLPAYVGANPYLQAYDRGVKIIGATAHFVTDN